MYIAVASIWLRVVDGVALTRWDVTGALIALVGMRGMRCSRRGVEEWAWVGGRLVREAGDGQERSVKEVLYSSDWRWPYEC